MKNKIFYVFSAVFFLLFAFLSCSVDNYEESSGSPVLKFDIGNSNARNALPDVQLDDFNAFELTISGITDKEYSKQFMYDSYKEFSEASIVVNEGEYNFSLVAACDSVIYMAEQNKTVSKGLSKISFELILADGFNFYGEGNINVKIRFPTENVKAVTAGLYDMKLNSVPGYNDEELDFEKSGNAVYSKEEVVSGNYILIFKFYADTEKQNLLGYYREYALIADKLTSSSSVVLDALDSLYSIAYELNGGSFSDAKTVPGSYTRKSSVIELPKNVVKPNNQFLGWYEQSDFSGEVQTVIPSNSSGNKTFYAKWIPTHTITFSVSGDNYFAKLKEDGTEESQSKFFQQTVIQDEPVVLNSINFMNLVSKTTFLGWSKTEGGTVSYYDGDSIEKGINSNMTLYAIFSACPVNPTGEDDPKDTDEDKITDWDEIHKYYTNPMSKDTDGDGWSDYEEINMYDEGTKAFDPRIADLPKIKVVITSEPRFGYIYEISSSESKSEEFSVSQESGHTSGSESSKAHETSMTHGWSVSAGGEFGNENKFVGQVGVSGSYSESDSYSYGSSNSVSYSQSMSNGKAQTYGTQKDVKGGTIRFTIQLENQGNIAVKLSKVGFTLKQILVNSNSPDTMDKNFLSLSQDVNCTLQPGERTTDIAISNSELSIEALESLLRNTLAISIYPSEMAYSMQEENVDDNFTKRMTTVSAQTARIVIDYGLKSGNALKTEQYNVSTKTKLNYSSTNINNVFQPISLREIFGVIGLSTQAEDGEIPQLVLDENGQIKSIRGVEKESDSSKGDWYIIHTYTKNALTYSRMYNYQNFFHKVPDEKNSYNIDDIFVSAHDVVNIIYSEDKDKDGVPAHEEDLYGTSDENIDSDGDGLSDFQEIYGRKNSRDETVTSNPLLKDTDNDEIPDNEDDYPCIAQLGSSCEIEEIQFFDSVKNEIAKFNLSSGELKEKYLLNSQAATTAEQSDSSFEKVSKVVTDFLAVKFRPKLRLVKIKYSFNSSDFKPLEQYDESTNVFEFLLNGTDLKYGKNTIDFEVVSPNGENKKNYTVVVYSDFKIPENFKLTTSSNPDKDGEALIFGNIDYSSIDSRLSNTKNDGYVLFLQEAASSSDASEKSSKMKSISRTSIPGANMQSIATEGLYADWYSVSKGENDKVINDSTSISVTPVKWYAVSVFGYINKNSETEFKYKKLLSSTIESAPSYRGTMKLYIDAVENIKTTEAGRMERYWTFDASIPPEYTNDIKTYTLERDHYVSLWDTTSEYYRKEYPAYYYFKTKKNDDGIQKQYKGSHVDLDPSKINLEPALTCNFIRNKDIPNAAEITFEPFEQDDYREANHYLESLGISKIVFSHNSDDTVVVKTYSTDISSKVAGTYAWNEYKISRGEERRLDLIQCDKKGYLDWYGWLPDGTWTNVGKSIYDYHDIKNTGRGAVRLHFRVKYE
ncbi:MAG: InlB B-repeat-containing protein [Treponema sp.]|nr:InlB B-repeat-containing protein [Treponema sp.]